MIVTAKVEAPTPCADQRFRLTVSTLLLLIFLVSMLLSTGQVSAATATLAFNSLPSAQGWTYLAYGGVAETTVFSVDGTTLHQNTIGLGNRGSEYRLSGCVLNPALPFTLDIRARVLTEVVVGNPNDLYGFGFHVDIGGERYGIGLSTGAIYPPHADEVLLSIDNTQFHNFRVEGVPGLGYSVFVDNVLIVSNRTPDTVGTSDHIAFGDVTGDTAAEAEITRFVFTQGPGSLCDEDNDGVDDAHDVCPETVLPERIPTVRLGVNRFIDVDGDGIFDTTPPPGKVPQRTFTLQETGGCSCEQIIVALELGEGHMKFGCSISAMEEWIREINSR